MKKKTKAFSIIEVMIWIILFTMWIISVYAVIVSTLKMNDYNKNYVIATWLAREQIELIRNIRDSNYKKIQIYNQINPATDNHSNLFETGTYYKVENNFSDTADFPIKVEKINVFWEWVDELNWKMNDYKLNYSWWIYSYYSWEPTHFYKYIKVDDITYSSWWTTYVIDKWFKVTSKVIWYDRWYHEYEVKSLFTDFKMF